MSTSTPTPGTIKDTSAPASLLSLEEAVAYLTLHERTADAATISLNVGKVRQALATLRTDTSRAAVVEEALGALLAHYIDLADSGDAGFWDPEEEPVIKKVRAALATPAAATRGQWERWYLGAQNDGLYIINAPPRPSNDDQWHDRPDGPTMAISVHGLSDAKAREIVDAHNAAFPPPPAQGGR